MQQARAQVKTLALVEDHVHEETGQTMSSAAAVIGESRETMGRTWIHIDALMGSHCAPQEESTAEQNVRCQPLDLSQVAPSYSVPTIRAQCIVEEGSGYSTGDKATATLMSNISSFETEVAEAHAECLWNLREDRRRCKPGYGICHRHSMACSRST